MTRLWAILQIGPVRHYRERTRGVRDMSVDDTMALVRRIDAAGVVPHLVGGWGVDALVGRQTRMHDDLDLAYEALPGSMEALVGSLVELGYAVAEVEVVPRALFPVRVLMADGHGHSIDLLPFRTPGAAETVEPPPGVQASALPVRGRDDFVSGVLRTRRRSVHVRCLDPALQLSARAVHELRPADHHDVARLNRLGRRGRRRPRSAVGVRPQP